MIGFDELVERSVREVAHDDVFALLPDETQAQIRALSDEDVRESARQVFTRPQPGYVAPAKRLLMNPCLAVQWLSLLEHCDLPRNLRVFEPCTGASEPVILAAAVYSGGTGEYTAVNLNRPLAAQLREKLGKIRMSVRIIEDDATRAVGGLAPGAVDAACFHHAINDILQTAVSEPRGMDTRTVDWWPNERQMIEWLAEEDRAARLDGEPRAAMLGAVEQAVTLVRPGGWLLFDHWTWEGHREMDWFPWHLYCDLIPITRAWIAAAGLPVEEVSLPGWDPRWWMCLRRTA